MKRPKTFIALYVFALMLFCVGSSPLIKIDVH